MDQFDTLLAMRGLGAQAGALTFYARVTARRPQALDHAFSIFECRIVARSCETGQWNARVRTRRARVVIDSRRRSARCTTARNLPGPILVCSIIDGFMGFAIPGRIPGVLPHASESPHQAQGLERDRRRRAPLQGFGAGTPDARWGPRARGHGAGGPGGAVHEDRARIPPGEACHPPRSACPQDRAGSHRSRPRQGEWSRMMWALRLLVAMLLVLSTAETSWSEVKLNVGRSASDLNEAGEPARFHVTWPKDATTTWSFDIAATAAGLVTDRIYLGPTVEYHRNTQIDSPQDAFRFGAT